MTVHEVIRAIAARLNERYDCGHSQWALVEVLVVGSFIRRMIHEEHQCEADHEMDLNLSEGCISIMQAGHCGMMRISR